MGGTFIWVGGFRMQCQRRAGFRTFPGCDVRIRPDRNSAPDAPLPALGTRGGIGPATAATSRSYWHPLRLQRQLAKRPCRRHRFSSETKVLSFCPLLSTTLRVILSGVLSCSLGPLLSNHTESPPYPALPRHRALTRSGPPAILVPPSS